MFPDEYPRRPLLAVTGLSPQIVTETLYALAVRPDDGPRRFVPTEVHIITTQEGAERAKLALLHPESGWFHRLRAEYDLPPIAFDTSRIHTLKDAAGRAIEDLRTPADNTAVADAITDFVRDLAADPDCAMHVSIAGGRKTMGFYLGYALSLYGREQDRLSHVLVSAPYESHPHFFYPTRASVVIHTLDRDSRPYDAREARVALADIPFVRLRDELPPGFVDGSARFGDSVAAAQRAITPIRLVLDATRRRVCAAGESIALSPVQFSFLAMFARRQQRGPAWLACPSEGAPEMEHARAFLAELGRTLGELDDSDRTLRRLQDGMTRDFFSETKSKLHRTLRRSLGRHRVQPYLITSEGGRLNRRYGLTIAPGAIRFL